LLSDSIANFECILLFRLADLDKDGKLTEGEFVCFQHPYLCEHWDEFAAPMLDEEMTHQDKDGDGFISWDELWGGYVANAEMGMTMEEIEDGYLDQMKKEFANLDGNGDKKLSKAEFQEFVHPDPVRIMDPRVKRQMAEFAKGVVEKMDKDKNTKIQLSELLEHSEWLKEEVRADLHSAYFLNCDDYSPFTPIAFIGRPLLQGGAVISARGQRMTGSHKGTADGKQQTKPPPLGLAPLGPPPTRHQGRQAHARRPKGPAGVAAYIQTQIQSAGIYASDDKRQTKNPKNKNLGPRGAANRQKKSDASKYKYFFWRLQKVFRDFFVSRL
jgi:Ca2+-binding EF-hand superfamily protein